MENTTLTVSDLASMKAIIEAACNRGAFKANEMRQIGELYEKLESFLNSLQPPAESQSTTADQGIQPGDNNA